MSDRMVVQHLNQDFLLGTLAPLDAIQQVTKIDASRNQGIKVKKIVGNWTIDDLTAGQGPILVGMSTGLASASLVEECLEADPQGLEDAAAMEKSNRKVAPQALLTQSSDGAVGGGEGVFRVQSEQYFPWKEIPEESGLELWAYNTSAAALSTTDPTVKFVGVVVGEWLRD